MADLALKILEPLNGARIAGSAAVRLRASASGNTAGLFFKWYSTINPAATVAHAELNAADHSAAALDFTTLLDVGTHVITLAAADQDGNDLDSVKQVTRAASTGGGPSAPAPRLVHRYVAVLKTPAAGATLSRAEAILEVRAPSSWAKPVGREHDACHDPPQSAEWVMDPAYQAINGLQYRFRFAPATLDPAHAADLTPAPGSFVFFIDDRGLPYLRWMGELPLNLLNGNHSLTLYVESPDQTVSHSATISVVLAA
jgi:hypothetical protein